MGTTLRRVVAVVALALLAAAGAHAQEARRGEGAKEEFSFYGLRLGMTEDEARAIYPNAAAGREVMNPGHGMLYLVVQYDWRRRLSEIRAAYERPEDPLRYEALGRALRERFVQPIGARWRDVAVSIDEYSNRAALTLVLSSVDLREESLTHFKNEYLQKMD
jgi:hypothetical protein